MIWAPVALLAALLASCGGGGGVSPPPEPGAELNDPSCFYQYTMPGSILPRTGPDPLFSSLWHLENTGQDGGTPGEDIRALPAWSLNKGEGVRVALLDDGLELFHEDLVANVVAGGSYDYGNNRYGFPLPCEADDDHGTQVAGVLAARDGNDIGVAGAAPRAAGRRGGFRQAAAAAGAAAGGAATSWFSPAAPLAGISGGGADGDG